MILPICYMDEVSMGETGDSEDMGFLSKQKYQTGTTLGVGFKPFDLGREVNVHWCQGWQINDGDQTSCFWWQCHHS